MSHDDSQLHYLDSLVPTLARGRDEGFWTLSHGQRAYVALAASRVDLLKADGLTIPQAINRLDEGWLLPSWA